MQICENYENQGNLWKIHEKYVNHENSWKSRK